MQRIKKGDEVIVLVGKNQGKRGKVVSSLSGDKVVVENVNVAKKHTKPNPAQNLPGGILDKEMPIHISNVALYNPVTKKGDRVGYKRLENGIKVRYFKSNGEVVDV